MNLIRAGLSIQRTLEPADLVSIITSVIKVVAADDTKPVKDQVS
jgi:hypothetical protein